MRLRAICWAFISLLQQGFLTQKRKSAKETRNFVGKLRKIRVHPRVSASHFAIYSRHLVVILIWLTACQQPDPIPPTATIPPSPTPLVGVDFVTIAPPTTISILQFTPTPLPTATATPLPTPIVYTVGEGDTLYDIAFFNGTTVDEILALNQQISPNFISIGQTLVLPPPSRPLNQTQSATPIPIQLSVTSLRLFETPVGSSWVLGTVRNDSATPAENVSVQIDLIDETGNLVETVVAESAVSLLPPNTIAPFGILLNEPNPNIKGVGSTVASGISMIDLGNRYLDISVVDYAQSIENNAIVVTGNMQNQGETQAGNILLVATFLDNQGTIAGYFAQRFEESLAPNDSLSFTFTTAPPNPQVAEILFSVSALSEN